MKFFPNANELFKNIKHRSPTRIFCPKCCNSEIKTSSFFDSWLTPTKYVCEKCGYIGPIFLELEKKEDEGL
ncbi:hypothetical protein MUO66_00730 [Candidatus Bathyarchaeota archaeon]|nr:hypothetical protein [Candidatus Bathyarchaeota archaeon]